MYTYRCAVRDEIGPLSSSHEHMTPSIHVAFVSELQQQFPWPQKGPSAWQDIGAMS